MLLHLTSTRSRLACLLKNALIKIVAISSIALLAHVKLDTCRASCIIAEELIDSIAVRCID